MILIILKIIKWKFINWQLEQITAVNLNELTDIPIFAYHNPLPSDMGIQINN